MALVFGEILGVSVFGICTVFMICVLSAPLVESSTPPVKVSADTVEVDHEGKRATLTGSVQIRWNELTLNAMKISVTYTRDGAPQHWLAEGNVRVQWREYILQSKTLKVDQTKESLIFWGPLDLVQGLVHSQSLPPPWAGGGVGRGCMRARS